MRELEEIPLCANCLSEIEDQELSDDTVVEKALTLVESRDGGLNRLRREMKLEASTIA
jgi:hypothetical protein